MRKMPRLRSQKNDAQNAPPTKSENDAQDAQPTKSENDAQDAPPTESEKHAQDAPPTESENDAQDAPSTESELIERLRFRFAAIFVGFHDPLNEFMANNVASGEIYESDSRDAGQHSLGVGKPGHSPRGQIGLRDVAGDNRLGVEAEPREKHFHLLNRGVLSFVKNDKRVVESPAAHKGDRRHFDDVAFDITFKRFRGHHVVQGIVQRSKVRVDFGSDISRQEAEPFAGFDSRARQDNTAYQPAFQRRDSHRHGEIRLSGTCRTDSEHKVVRLYCLHVLFLPRSLGSNNAALREYRYGLAGRFRRLIRTAILGNSNGILDVVETLSPDLSAFGGAAIPAPWRPYQSDRRCPR